MVKLGIEDYKEYQTSNSITDHVRPISSLEYSDSGEYCLTGSILEDCIFIINCKAITAPRKKYKSNQGICHVRFSHKSTAVLHTTKQSLVKLWSLWDNSYIRTFKGHTKPINSLEVSPINDVFISASGGDMLKIWDLRSPFHVGAMLLDQDEIPTLAFDPSGHVLAVAMQNMHESCRDTVCDLHFFDLRNYSNGPFLEKSIKSATLGHVPVDYRIQRLKFNLPGSRILAVTNDYHHLVIDAFEGTLVSEVSGFTPVKNTMGGYQADWTPCGKYVATGSGDGVVQLFDPLQGEPLALLESDSAAQVQCIAYNHRLELLSTCSDNSMSFWLPKLNSEEQ
eukprot:NODE_700_length_5043_cov_0.336367.p2 type:complete len:337 gc:universal NODE_700_length_5043_cov_0.336367:4255-3245(-)